MTVPFPALLRRFWLAAAVAILLPSLAPTQSVPPAPDEEIRRSLEHITRAFDVVTNNLAERVDPERAVYDGLLPGIMSRLDPFSVFLDSEQYLQMQQQALGVRKGFGAVLSIQPGKITVLQSIPDSPFGRAGLGPGDRIVSVNGQRIASMGLEEMIELLNQARSDKVRLAVMTGGRVVPQDYELDPAEVPSPSVDKKFLWDPTLAYLHLARIEPGTPDEIRQALESWKDVPLRGLLLDLRDNPGGSVQAAVGIAGLFLEQGSRVVQLMGRSVPEQVYSVPDSPSFPALPLVVLLNGRSASASEMIAAALQEHDRGWLVGTASFGKGVAESVLPLTAGNALVLTTARYYTPQGRSLQKPLPGTALAAILETGPRAFVTRNGRPIKEQGGVEPDQIAEAWNLQPWTEALQQTTAFVNFAEQLVDRQGRVPERYSVDDPTMEEFNRFLTQAGVIVPEEIWQRDLPFIRMRIEAEVLNLVYGIAAGDQAELRADPQVRAAVDALPRAAQILEFR
jgi:carboxyl-terminal processing protease